MVKIGSMIMYVVGIVLTLFIIAQLLPQGIGPILNVANVNVSINGVDTPFGDISGASALIPLIILIATVSVIGILVKIVRDAVSGEGT